MFKEKKKKKKSCLFWGLNPRPSVSMQLTVVLAYLSTLQSGGNAFQHIFFHSDASKFVKLAALQDSTNMKTVGNESVAQT
jgi:hypothetical protein